MNKQNRDRLTDREQADSYGGASQGVERSSKKEKAVMDMDNSVEIVRREGL